MQIQQLTYFVVIAEQGSFNKAAEKLAVTVPELRKTGEKDRSQADRIQQLPAARL